MDDLVKRLRHGKHIETLADGTQVWASAHVAALEAADRIEDLEKKLTEAQADQLQWLTYRHVIDRVEGLEKQVEALQRERDALLELKPNADMRELRAACKMALEALNRERIMCADGSGNYTIEATAKHVHESIAKLREVLK